MIINLDALYDRFKLWKRELPQIEVCTLIFDLCSRYFTFFPHQNSVRDCILLLPQIVLACVKRNPSFLAVKADGIGLIKPRIFVVNRLIFDLSSSPSTPSSATRTR